MKKMNYRVKAGIAAMVFAVGGSSLLGNFCTNAPVVVRAEAGTKAETKTENKSQQVVNLNTSWKYLDNNTDPAAGLGSLTAWTAPDFNDSSWKEAAGSFGAKKGALTSFDGYTPTVLLQQYIEGTETDVPAFFFRTKFNLSDIKDITSITGTLCHDDAVAVYLNGHLIKSQYMNSEGQKTNLYYSGVSQGAPEKLDVKLTKDQVAEYAVEGENVLSVELHNDRETSSDIYFEFTDLTVNYNETEAPTEQKSLMLTLGSDESSRGLTWYANTEKAGEVQYAKASAMKNGQFPAEYTSVDASSIPTNDEGFYSNQAVLSNLEENTEYVYRVVNGDTVSKTYTFKTGDYDSSFSFAFVGDPQIGAGTTASDIEGWNETLDTIQKDMGVDFLLSAGDQVNSNSNEEQYAGYINDAFSSLASVTTIGNHDSGNAAYNEHFNLPNESTTLGQTNAGTDYWFVYNNTLFMDLNSNDLSTAEHKEFMEAAIAANPGVKWKTVIFHHSVYSTASHTNDSDVIQRREELPPVLDELGIDVVLMGHDHVYTRTYMMDGVTPDTSKGVQSEVTDPEGVLYLTANSASGSKYYDIKAPEAAFAAVMDQSYRRTVTDVEITDTSYTMTTYYADTMEVLDKFTIHKTSDVDTSALNALISEAQKLNEKDYPADLWKEFETAYQAAENFETDMDTTQADVDAVYANLKTAMDKLAASLPGKDDGNTENPDNGGNQNNAGTPDNGENQVNTGNQTNTGNQNKNNISGTSVSTVSSKKTGTPKTGDNAAAAVPAVIMLAAAGCAAVVFQKRRKAD